MMTFLQTGKALYVLAAICAAGILTRLLASSFYKRLIRESQNLALTKNRCLRALRQSTEDTYRINQGMNNVRVYLERQFYGLRVMGLSLRGLDNLSGQLTMLCFLAGGVGAFLSYWYRSDNYYIVLYGTMGVLGGMATMVAEGGVNLEAKKQQLLTCLQDSLENVLLPKLERENRADAQEQSEPLRSPVSLRSGARERRGQLRRGALQTAASREHLKESQNEIPRPAIVPDQKTQNWLQDLSPDQKRALGEMLRDFMS